MLPCIAQELNLLNNEISFVLNIPGVDSLVRDALEYKKDWLRINTLVTCISVACTGSLIHCSSTWFIHCISNDMITQGNLYIRLYLTHLHIVIIVVVAGALAFRVPSFI